MDAEWQTGKGSRERCVSYSQVNQGKVAPGSWKPMFVTASEGGLRKRGVGCCCCSLPGRQDLLDPGFAPVKIIFLSCFHTPSPCGPNCALGCFDCISTVFTVIFGEIFNLVCCLFMVLFLQLVLQFTENLPRLEATMRRSITMTQNTWSSPMSTPHQPVINNCLLYFTKSWADLTF